MELYQSSSAHINKQYVHERGLEKRERRESAEFLIKSIYI